MRNETDGKQQGDANSLSLSHSEGCSFFWVVVVGVVAALCDPESPRVPVANSDVTNPETPQDGEDERPSDHQTGVAVRRPRSFVTAGPPFPEKKYILTDLSLFYKRREKKIPHVIYSSSLMSYYITYFLMPGLILSAPHPFAPLPPPEPQTATYCFNLCHRKYFSKLEGETFWIMNLRWPAKVPLFFFCVLFSDTTDALSDLCVCLSCLLLFSSVWERGRFLH